MEKGRGEGGGEGRGGEVFYLQYIQYSEVAGIYWGRGGRGEGGGEGKSFIGGGEGCQA